MFTRIFSSILDSSINMPAVSPRVRWLFIVMLIIADEARTGAVDMPIERLAARAGLSVEDTRAALDELMAPDPNSKSPDHAGRRVIPMRAKDGRGWVIVNYEKYKEIEKAEQERARVRKAVRDLRDRKRNGRQRNVTECNASEAAHLAASSLTSQPQGEPEKFWTPESGKELPGWMREILGGHNTRWKADSSPEIYEWFTKYMKNEPIPEMRPARLPPIT